MLAGVALAGSGNIAEQLYSRPAITVIGIDAPAVEGAANVVAARARAAGPRACAARPRPGAVRQRGGRAPPADGRPGRCAPCSSSLTRAAARGFAARTDGPAYAAAVKALEAAYGSPVLYYGMGGSIPLVAAFHAAAPDAEMILWGAEEPQPHIHAANESVDLAELDAAPWPRRCSSRRCRRLRPVPWGSRPGQPR